MLALTLSKMLIFILLILDPSLKYEKVVFSNSEITCYIQVPVLLQWQFKVRQCLWDACAR